jgi:hypothetical protein
MCGTIELCRMIANMLFIHIKFFFAQATLCRAFEFYLRESLFSTTFILMSANFGYPTLETTVIFALVYEALDDI